MSLEQTIAENTASLDLLKVAVKELTKLFSAAANSKAPEQTPEPAKTKTTKPKADPKTDAPKTEPATTPAVTGPSLKLVTDTVLEFAATESVAAKAILKSFGVSRITELKAEMYPKVLDAVAAAKVKIAEELATGNDDDPNSLV